MTVGSTLPSALPGNARLETLPGDASWEQARPLFEAVWPPALLATFSWAHVVWANAQRRVLVWNGAGELVCHVGIHCRQATWTGSPVRIGGIGGVITRQDARRQGHASAAIRLALAQMKNDDGADFALLFCEPHNFDFYRGLGWRRFAADVFCEQPQGRVRFDVMAAFVFDLRLSPKDGAIDLCGRPW
jgi:aminoglycoside 2'-N-acetyltransferase I